LPLSTSRSGTALVSVTLTFYQVQQVADEGGAAGLVELDDLLLLELVEGQLDHADGALDDARAGVDDRLGLLATQHHAGDLLGVREVADADLDHLDPGVREAVGELAHELVVDLLGVAAQGGLPGVGRVVGVTRGGRAALELGHGGLRGRC